MTESMAPADNICGPVALANAAGLTYKQVKAAWQGWRGNRTDSPWHHLRACRNLKLRMRIVTCGDILAYRVPDGRCVVLLHSQDSPLLGQHWARVLGTAAGGGVRLDWGDGREKIARPAAFIEAYSAATPACAYVVGEGDVPTLTLYQRLYCWVTSL